MNSVAGLQPPALRGNTDVVLSLDQVEKGRLAALSSTKEKICKNIML